MLMTGPVSHFALRVSSVLTVRDFVLTVQWVAGEYSQTPILGLAKERRYSENGGIESHII